MRGFLPTEFQRESELLDFPLRVGCKLIPAKELLKIEGDFKSLHWRFEGNCSRLHHLGAGLSKGQIEVNSDVGRHCGARLAGGQIHIQGNAGDWLGAAMSGGELRVGGDAGRLAGGCYPGEKMGMRGGVLLVGGAVGDDAAQAMRRGLMVAVRGCGARAGYRMRAGTLLLLGPSGPDCGLDMLRGTIGLFGVLQGSVPSSFRRACRISPSAVSLLCAEVERLLGPKVSAKVPREVELLNGDLLRGGRGEMLLAAG